MKKVLCVKDYCGFKEGQIAMLEESLIGDKFRLYENESAYRLVGLGVHACFRDIETFEHEGEEWIKHDAGFCPVPDDWVVCVMIGNKTGQNVASKYYWGKRGAPTIDAYRVISTAKEKPAPKAEAQEEESFEKTQYDENKEMIEVDFRERSPQELAFAAKHSEPEKPKPLAFPDVKLNDNFSCHVGGKWG